MTESNMSPQMSDSVVLTQGLIKRFDNVTALNDINIEVPKGTIYGFIGPSGCGKTTTVRCLIGNYRPTEGVVKVLGQTPEDFSREQRKQIGYMPQLFVLYPELTVWENLNFAASIYGYPMKRKDRLRELLDLVELSGHEKKLVRNISGGMQRRLSLATTLIHDPPLVFLDEPTAGIDPVLRRKFWDYFRKLRDEGHTLFVTTQYVGEAAYCDYVGVMARGEILMVETPEDLRYKAMGGDIIQFQTASPLASEQIQTLHALPFVKGDSNFIDARTLQVTVDDAGTAIPDILHWSEDQGIEIEAIIEQVPPFDDVFVQVMKDYGTGQEKEE